MAGEAQQVCIAFLSRLITLACPHPVTIYDWSMLNERLKNLRLAKGMTLQQVGDAFGISAASVASWEKGKNQPDSRKLSQLAEVLGTTVDFLINGDGNFITQRQESGFPSVPFINWNQLSEIEIVHPTKSVVQPLHTKLSDLSFATRFPCNGDLNWNYGPFPSGALIFIDPLKQLQTECWALIKLQDNSVDLARVQMPLKSSGFYLKLHRSGTTVKSGKEVTILGCIVEWQLSGII